MIVSNATRRFQKTQEANKRWSIKAQRKGAVLFGITGDATLVQALTVNEVQLNGITKLPLGASRSLIAAGKVWLNSEVCTDPERAVKKDDYVAVFPSAEMERVVDGEGRSSIRRREVVGM